MHEFADYSWAARSTVLVTSQACLVLHRCSWASLLVEKAWEEEEGGGEKGGGCAWISGNPPSDSKSSFSISSHPDSKLLFGKCQSFRVVISPGGRITGGSKLPQ
jgi:hypothetical protein